MRELFFNGDCIDFLSNIDDNSVDLIATDPPYYKVKKDDWDRQWNTKKDFFSWLTKVLSECERVLKPTGSIYLFAGPYTAAETELLMTEHFNVLNHIVWRKESGRHKGCNKESLRKYFPQTERIIFADSKKKKPFRFESIRSYLDEQITKHGMARRDVDKATNTKMSGHWLGRSQFAFPSRKNYSILKTLAPTLKSYDKLRAEYLEIHNAGKAAGRRFNLNKHVPYTDFWDFAPVPHYSGKHPCEKPIDLMEHIIRTSSNPGDLVVDPFLGSGSTAIASINLKRQFAGSEKGFNEYRNAIKRIDNETSTKFEPLKITA